MADNSLRMILFAGAFAVSGIVAPVMAQEDTLIEAEQDLQRLNAVLIEAAAAGDQMAAARFIAHGADINAVLDGDGTALIAAARNGRQATVASLIAAGADVNLASPGDGAPLIAAATVGHKSIVQRLLEAGADVNLGSAGDGNALIKAAAGGHLDVMRTLLAAGADPNAIVPDDETPLINAAQSGQIEAVKLLVEEAGADASLSVVANRPTGRQRRSPLSEAVRNNHQDIVDYLRSKGAQE